jgi:hypothetical protein
MSYEGLNCISSVSEVENDLMLGSRQYSRPSTRKASVTSLYGEAVYACNPNVCRAGLSPSLMSLMIDILHCMEPRRLVQLLWTLKSSLGTPTARVTRLKQLDHHHPSTLNKNSG